jgi:acetylornithine deacetylase/succinyl-diaminopimelate desuccinylase-like protein
MTNFQIDADRVVRWAQAFARAPSGQTALFERDPQVQGFLSGPVAGALTSGGLSFRRDAMGGLIVEVGDAGDGPCLMLMGYAMTHPANRMKDPYSGALIDGGKRILGRGLAEQKGALAAAIGAVAVAAQQKLKGRLVLAVTAAGETGRHDAAQAALTAMDRVPDTAIIAIGTSGRLALGNKGRIDIDIVVKGLASHSSTPWAGVNAIEGAQMVIERLAALNASAKEDALFGKATLVPTAIRSWPEATHTIQDEVRLVFDRRLLPGDKVDDVYETIAEAAQLPEPWRVTVTKAAHMFPACIDVSGHLAQAVAKGSQAQGIAAPSVFYSNGALDAGLFCDVGKEAAMWGPGDMGMWHSDSESIGVDELVQGAKGYLGLIQAYLT